MLVELGYGSAVLALPFRLTKNGGMSLAAFNLVQREYGNKHSAEVRSSARLHAAAMHVSRRRRPAAGAACCLSLDAARSQDAARMVVEMNMHSFADLQRQCGAFHNTRQKLHTHSIEASYGQPYSGLDEVNGMLGECFDESGLNCKVRVSFLAAFPGPGVAPGAGRRAASGRAGLEGLEAIF